MTKFKVRVVDRVKLKEDGFLAGTFNEVFEATSKKEALKLARTKYKPDKFALGRVWKQKGENND